MRVFIETPRWSFTKYGISEGMLEKEYVSPLPTLFNYGFVIGTKAADGMEEDAIVLGKTLKQGQTVEVREVGVVRFRDGGLEDDKLVMSSGVGAGFVDRAMINVFFTVYAVFKTLRSGKKCAYEGVEFRR